MVDEAKSDIDIKIVILGVSEVGKTCLLFKYFEDKFYESSLSSIGIDYKTKFFKFEGLKVRANYVDTAGQERFHGLSSNFLKYAHGVVFVYSIDSQQSLHKLTDWIEAIDRTKIAFIIVGNKCDLDDKQRKVKFEEGENFAKQYGSEFYEVSAKSGINVNDVFDKIGFMTYEKVKANEHVNGEVLTKKKKKNKIDNLKCCN